MLSRAGQTLLDRFPPTTLLALVFWFLFLNLFYARQLTGLFYSSKQNNSNKTCCDLWQSTWSHFSAFIPFDLTRVVGAWCPAGSDQGTNQEQELLLLSPCWTWTLSGIYLPYQCKHSRHYEMKELQKFIHLLQALSIPSSSTEQNHTLALCRLHIKKSLVRGGKKNHHKRGKLLDGFLCLFTQLR